MKKLIGIIVAICIARAVLFYFFGNTSTPEKTINDFEKAFNEQDYNGMLDCIEPVTATAIRGGVNLVGGLFGLDGQSLIDVFPLLTDITEEMGAEYAQLDLEILEIVEDGDSAWATVEETHTGETMELSLVRVDGTWYLLLD